VAGELSAEKRDHLFGLCRMIRGLLAHRPAGSAAAHSSAWSRVRWAMPSSPSNAWPCASCWRIAARIGSDNRSRLRPAARVRLSVCCASRSAAACWLRRNNVRANRCPLPASCAQSIAWLTQWEAADIWPASLWSQAADSPAGGAGHQLALPSSVGRAARSAAGSYCRPCPARCRGWPECRAGERWRRLRPPTWTRFGRRPRGARRRRAR
jgi:hypothetical protein